MAHLQPPVPGEEGPSTCFYNTRQSQDTSSETNLELSVIQNTVPAAICGITVCTKLAVENLLLEYGKKCNARMLEMRTQTEILELLLVS